MKLNVLSNKVAWFGKYSGYECLPQYYPKDVNTSIFTSKFNIVRKFLGKFYKNQNRWSGRSEDIYTGIEFLRNIDKSSSSHILYLEGNIHLLSKLKKANKKLYGTIHFPISLWKHEWFESLPKMDNVIILYKEDIDKFGKYISRDKIHLIKHGVDVDFFKPGDPAAIQNNKILFVGHFLRNFEMFLKVYEVITNEITESLEFHFIIPEQHRDIAVLNTLSRCDNVFFHEKLSDEELLNQYQTSYVLLMPMKDSGANTAIIQALATGLPIITTDVGGIRSYGGGDIFSIVENNNIHDMVKLFYKYFFDISFRNEIAQKQRDFAVRDLDWNLIAEQHIKLFKN